MIENFLYWYGFGVLCVVMQFIIIAIMNRRKTKTRKIKFGAKKTILYILSSWVGVSLLFDELIERKERLECGGISEEE